MTLIPLLVYMYRINLMHHHTVAMKSMTNQISKFLFHDFFSFCEVCDLKQNVFISRGDNIVMLVSHMCREKKTISFWFGSGENSPGWLRQNTLCYQARRFNTNKPLSVAFVLANF